ncbi:MAG TPA: alpha-glucan family phosphorylase [Candidatus Tectomicrobia bacterium]|nr:alpha-glucan family phosphorylase [Candidatus Tectomicrobia bacterium]
MAEASSLPTVAYFSMEVALENAMPTYSGGLGVLAGDTLRSAADLGVPMVGVTLLHRRGYFFQRLDAEGRQIEEPVEWPVDDFVKPLDGTCLVDIEGRQVMVRAWRYVITGATGATVPVLMLDTDVEGNSTFDRQLTDHLYGGDLRYRLCQEVVLGVGGVRMLRVLGYTDVGRFHMNEGHAALLALELFAEELGASPTQRDHAVARVKRRCIFTTHTPVPAGHDQFALDLAQRVLTPAQMEALQSLGCCDTVLNMTFVALHLSDYINGVTKRHGDVSRSMFPGYPIGSITNGVHSVTWTAPEFQALYDKHIPDWRHENLALRYAFGIPLEAIAQAHRDVKRRLVQEVNRVLNAGFDQDVLTLGFARRATAYKRPDLLFHDLERLRAVAAPYGRLQLVFAGKAHPRDEGGKALIRQIFQWGSQLKPEVTLAYLPNYDMELGLLLTAGSDVWLNTPQPPYEASGTSGMKAAHNGVPSFSVLDGWWLEGHVEGMTGWAIGPRYDQPPAKRRDAEEAQELYAKLERTILPLYHHHPVGWTEVMRYAIALNASFFNTHRMMYQYAVHAYRNRGSHEQR